MLEMNSFAVLGDPTRRRIVELLANHPLSSGEIAGRFAVSASAISQHLKVLRAAGLVRARVAAQRRIYDLEPKGLDELEAWLKDVRGFWATRLDPRSATGSPRGTETMVASSRGKAETCGSWAGTFAVS